MLYRNAPVEEFNARLAEVEALPGESEGKARAIEAVKMAMDVKKQRDLHELSEQGLLVMVESAKDLSSRLDLTSLLNAIVARARNLLGSHLAWLTVYDAEADEFRVLVTDGATSINTTKMTVSRKHGIAGVVMSTRLPFHTPNYLLDNRFQHDPVLDNTFRDEGVAAMAGVPLLFNDDVIGLLFIADRYPRAHTASNIAILSALATHAAVAINNAKAFEQAQMALRNADQARDELEHRARDIQSAAEAHEQLTSLLARGSSLATLAQTVAQLLDGAVLVLDEAFQVIGRARAPGYAGAAADAYVPHDARSAAITQAIRDSRQGGRSIIAYEENGEVCRVVAVIGGSGLLGAVLLFRRKDLGEISVRTFERSSSVIGVVLLSQERMEASRHRDVSALLRSLVSTHSDERASTLEHARRFGLDLSQPVSLILIDIEQHTADVLARRLRASALLSDLVLDEIDGALAILCATTRAKDVLKEVSGIANREFGGAFQGIHSRPVQSPAVLPGLYGALRRGLTILRRIGAKGQIVDQNQMALYSVLFESHDQESLKTFIAGSIGPLVAYDQKRGTQFAETLLNYLDSNQNARSTATNLGIHVNTVRQRLAHVDELLGHWSSPHRMLEIHVALRLRELTGGDS